MAEHRSTEEQGNVAMNRSEINDYLLGLIDDPQQRQKIESAAEFDPDVRAVMSEFSSHYLEALVAAEKSGVVIGETPLSDEAMDELRFMSPGLDPPARTETPSDSEIQPAVKLFETLRPSTCSAEPDISQKSIMGAVDGFRRLYPRNIVRSACRMKTASSGAAADSGAAATSISQPELLVEVHNSGTVFVGGDEVGIPTSFVQLLMFEAETGQLLANWWDILPLDNNRGIRSRRIPLPQSVIEGRDDLGNSIEAVAIAIPEELVSVVVKLDEIESFLSMLGDSTQCQAQGLLSFDRKKLIPELQVWRERLLSLGKVETEGQQDEASAAGPGSMTDPAESSQQGRAASRSRWVLPTSGAMAAAGGAALEDSRVTDDNGSVASIEGNTLGIYASVDQASGPVFAVHVAQRGREAEGPLSSFLVAVPLNSTRDTRVGRVTGLLEWLGIEQLDDLNFQVLPLEESELTPSDVQTLLDEDAAVRRVPELRGELQALLARLTESQSGG